MVMKFTIKKMKDIKPHIFLAPNYCFKDILALNFPMERATRLELATVCLEGRNSSQLSYTRILSSDLRLRIFVVQCFFLKNQEIFIEMAGWKGLEPSTSCVTGRRSNQLNYHPISLWRSYGESNPDQKIESLLSRPLDDRTTNRHSSELGRGWNRTNDQSVMSRLL